MIRMTHRLVYRCHVQVTSDKVSLGSLQLFNGLRTANMVKKKKKITRSVITPQNACVRNRSPWLLRPVKWTACQDVHGGHVNKFIKSCREYSVPWKPKQIGQLYQTNICVSGDSKVDYMDYVSQWTLEGFPQPWSNEINSMS